MEVNELIAHKPIDMVDRVKRLAENYFYITELVHQINHCFGLILLFILSTHVVLIYTGIVFISSHYKNGNDWYDFVPIIYYSIVFSVNILAVSFASDAVSKKVLLRSSILHELVTLNIYATLHLVFTGSFPTGEIQQTLVSFFYPKVRGRHNKCNSLIFWRSQAWILVFWLFRRRIFWARSIIRFLRSAPLGFSRSKSLSSQLWVYVVIVSGFNRVILRFWWYRWSAGYRPSHSSSFSSIYLKLHEDLGGTTLHHQLVVGKKEKYLI